MLKWQYSQILDELLLLQGHAASPDCPCSLRGEKPGELGEFCEPKHTRTIVALARETIPMESDEGRMGYLQKLMEEGSELLVRFEGKLCGKEDLTDYLTWARDKRKPLEEFYYGMCPVGGAEESGPEGFEQACIAEAMRRTRETGLEHGCVEDKPSVIVGSKRVIHLGHPGRATFHTHPSNNPNPSKADIKDAEEHRRTSFCIGYFRDGHPRVRCYNQAGERQGGEDMVASAESSSREWTPEKDGVKEPWQMTFDQWIESEPHIKESVTIGDTAEYLFSQHPGLPRSVVEQAVAKQKENIGLYREAHRLWVSDALSEGKPVPAEVLKDYPDLAKPTADVPSETGITFKHEKTDVGDIIVIYRDGEPVGNLRQIGKTHPDVEFRSSYIEHPIRAPMARLADVTQADVERIVAKYIPKQAIPQAPAGMPEEYVDPRLREIAGELKESHKKWMAIPTDERRRLEGNKLAEKMRGITAEAEAIIGEPEPPLCFRFGHPGLRERDHVRTYAVRILPSVHAPVESWGKIVPVATLESGLAKFGLEFYGEFLMPKGSPRLAAYAVRRDFLYGSTEKASEIGAWLKSYPVSEMVAGESEPEGGKATEVEVLHCPKCGRKRIRYSTIKGKFVCEDCGFESPDRKLFVRAGSATPVEQAIAEAKAELQASYKGKRPPDYKKIGAIAERHNVPYHRLIREAMTEFVVKKLDSTVMVTAKGSSSGDARANPIDPAIKELIDEVPDVDDPASINYWKRLDHKWVYLEGWGDQCLAGTGFPPIEEGEWDAKVEYIRDLTPAILERKAVERNLRLVKGGFYEKTEEDYPEHLYGVTWGLYEKVPSALEEPGNPTVHTVGGFNIPTTKVSSLGFVELELPERNLASIRKISGRMIGEMEPSRPEETGKLSADTVRELPTFRGYTVDARLREFRKVEYGKVPEFIPFDSPRGEKLLREMEKETKSKGGKRWVVFHSKSLPYYGEGYVSFYDEAGVEHRVKPEDFQDVSTEGGRAVEYYTFRVRAAASSQEEVSSMEKEFIEKEMPFAGAAEGKLWWLATIADKTNQVEVSGFRLPGLRDWQIEEAFADSVAKFSGFADGETPSSDPATKIEELAYNLANLVLTMPSALEEMELTAGSIMVELRVPPWHKASSEGASGAGSPAKDKATKMFEKYLREAETEGFDHKSIKIAAGIFRKIALTEAEAEAGKRLFKELMDKKLWNDPEFDASPTWLFASPETGRNVGLVPFKLSEARLGLVTPQMIPVSASPGHQSPSIILSPDEAAIPGFGGKFERCVAHLAPAEAKGLVHNKFAVCRAELRRSHGLTPLTKKEHGLTEVAK
ncbi:MAG: hypothetical protein CVV27_02640 [Candidatus Melainabacteria bacterium HGW-Melainabacteria-1]|nr:MAG: hypothetical protein CVV27_02640 [Candidatus Melainabacteria bacterium HGW-Melainabacteria-1]